MECSYLRAAISVVLHFTVLFRNLLGYCIIIYLHVLISEQIKMGGWNSQRMQRGYVVYCDSSCTLWAMKMGLHLHRSYRKNASNTLLRPTEYISWQTRCKLVDVVSAWSNFKSVKVCWRIVQDSTSLWVTNLSCPVFLWWSQQGMNERTIQLMDLLSDDDDGRCPLKCWFEPRCALPGARCMHTLRQQW